MAVVQPIRDPSPSPHVDPAQVRALIAPVYADRKLHTGETYLAHADGIAATVRGLRDDPDLLAAAYLFGAYDVLKDADDWLRKRCGDGVARLVADLRQLMKLSERTRPRASDEAGQGEVVRRMLLAMCNDLRVVLLRLASRLQTLRWYAASKAGDPTEYARETMLLYAPLANRLGVWQLKWELEDLAFRFLEPETYKQVARWLDGKRIEREAFIVDAKAELEGMLAAAGVRAEVSGRPKHIYSIWNKMRAKQLAFDELHDVRALRVIVDEVAQCYQVLSLVHQRWTPIAAEYDDYIAKPKANGYQSLHTVVTIAEGRTLEIQIRTRRMHAFAELGVAAHWRYKEGGKGIDADAERIAWLRQLLAWGTEVDAPPAGAPVRAHDRIYVLTPQARVVELAAGSTPIDFAYHLHTELGHRCRGAKIDGAMVPLNTRLQSGQTVEILAAKSGGPSRDWLNPELGFIVGQRSRAKVRAWFNALEHAQAVASGREIVDRELQRLGRTAVKLDDLAHRLGFESVEALCVAATKEEFSLRSIEQALTVAPPRRAGDSDADGQAARRAGRQGARAGGGRRLADDEPRALLPAGAARRDRRLRDARQGRVDPSRQLRERAGARQPATRAAHRRHLGRRHRCGLSGGRLRPGAGPAGPAARHLGGVRAREAQRHRREHRDCARRGAHAVHDRGRRHDGAAPRARADRRGQRRHRHAAPLSAFRTARAARADRAGVAGRRRRNAAALPAAARAGSCGERCACLLRQQIEVPRVARF